MRNLSTDPAALEDDAITKEITRLQAIGDLQMGEWTKDARPHAGWNFDAFDKVLESRKASIPAYAGAKPSAMGSGGWLDQVHELLGVEEGYHDRAYHGVKSSHRKGGDMFVRPGHQSSEEVSVGFGWNMQRKDTKQVFRSQLGLTDAETDDVFNGRRSITRAQGDTLRDYAVMEMNNSIDREMQGQPLRDHQRAALVSIAYNMGFTGLKGTGILQAMQAGKPDAEVAKLILDIPSNKARRKSEASQFLGAQATAFFKK